ncbi:hypothetical protein [Burkholderia orbicola]|uniref:hypothetical protein n=1 Tax=Burkholderia orbicola TaxID=2978683 RepID=UPI00264B0A82|nr:hypothetical protein [Burkholderia orbicola]MDN7558223.1 hypothetical protein [Burkholderia orbicola]
MGQKEKISAEEARWRAEDDARSLKRAAEIMGDRGRHAAAKAHIKGEISNMQKVLGTGAPREPRKIAPKPPAPREREKNPPPKRDMKEMPRAPRAKAK